MFQIPMDVKAVFDNFRTAELTTFAKDKTPLTWPVTVAYRSEIQEFWGTTSIGLPQKAFNIRQNGQVSLLFSEPKASGLLNPPAVLVQGNAEAPDSLTSVEGIEDVWTKIFRFQPASKQTSSGPLMHLLMDWYYIRIKIRIVPTRIKWWPEGDFARSPVEVGHVD